MIVKKYEMVAEEIAEYDTDIIGWKMKDSRDVADFIINTLNIKKYRQERFMVFLLDSKLKTSSFFDTGIGSLDYAPIHPRDVFAPAVSNYAAAVLVAHQHPSGDPTPSSEDILVTQRLQNAGEVLGIKLLDHLIIGDGCYISMKAEGYIQ